MIDIVRFVIVVIIILAAHYFLWGKIYNGWFRNISRGLKIALFTACLLVEALLTVLSGIYVLNIRL